MRPVIDEPRAASIFPAASAGEDISKRREECIVSSGNDLLSEVDIGEGCEPFVVMLGRFRKGRLWKGARFTKTQYADHFVLCHLAVVRMLDLPACATSRNTAGRCSEAETLESATDEGRYWETRDLEELPRNINASTDMIRAAAAFRRLMEERGFEVDAPIKQSANYVNVDVPE